MIGAIAGDVIGSTYEFHAVKTVDFDLLPVDSFFTDDTVCTIALAESLLTGGDFQNTLLRYCRRFPHAGYGSRFKNWIYAPLPQPYNSFGNGSAMRVSPVGFACQTEEEVLSVAEQSATITHNHPEGIKGAQATALSIFLAAHGADKATIKSEVEARFHYDLSRRLDVIRHTYTFNVTCQGSVPEAILAFIESSSYEEAVRLAVSLGGDADTQACISGGIAQAFYREIPVNIIETTFSLLTTDMQDTVMAFKERYGW